MSVACSRRIIGFNSGRSTKPGVALFFQLFFLPRGVTGCSYALGKMRTKRLFRCAPRSGCCCMVTKSSRRRERQIKRMVALSVNDRHLHSRRSVAVLHLSGRWPEHRLNDSSAPRTCCCRYVCTSVVRCGRFPFRDAAEYLSPFARDGIAIPLPRDDVRDTPE